MSTTKKYKKNVAKVWFKKLARDTEIRKQIVKLRERQGYPSNQRNDLLLAYFDIIIEHHEAIGVLIEKDLVGSGFALVRVVSETLYRALWVNACATSPQLDQLWKDDAFTFPRDTMARIDAAYLTKGTFQNVKMTSWKSMCSYAHSGLLQITRRFGGDGSVGPSYSEEEMLEVMGAITMMLMFAAILTFKSAGCDNAASEVEMLATTYSVPPQSGSS